MKLLVGVNDLCRQVRAIYTLSSELVHYRLELLVRTSWSACELVHYMLERKRTSSLLVGVTGSNKLESKRTSSLQVGVTSSLQGGV